MEKLRMRGAGQLGASASAGLAVESGKHDIVHAGQGLMGNFSALAEIPAVQNAKGNAGFEKWDDGDNIQGRMKLPMEQRETLFLSRATDLQNNKTDQG